MTRAVILLTCSLLSAAGPSKQPGVLREYSTGTVVDESPGATANVSLGDIDGDGDLDMVLAKGRHWSAVDRILINDGRGHFTAHDLGAAKDNSYSALLTDVDGDKDLDLVVSNDSELGRVYLNDGKAHFTLGSEWGAANWPARFATVADLNGDGRPDLISANRATQEGRRSHVCLNDGHGTMAACTELRVGPASGIAAADFDRDGDVDLAVPHRDGGQGYILYNDGKGSFSRTIPFGPDSSTASAIAAGDLDGNGWPDLVVGDETISTFVYLNDGKGAFGAGLQLKFEDMPAPRSIAFGDLNRDGIADIVIGYYDRRGSVLFNDGSGRHYSHVRFGDALDAVYGVAIGDLDGDGYPDIAAARNAGPTVVYFSRSGPGIDIVATSERPASPIPGLQPFNSDAGRFGVWRGLMTYDTYHRNVEVRLDNIAAPVGGLVGATNRLTNGIPYCRTTLTLVEQKPDGTYRFSESGVAGCSGAQGTVEARWLDPNHLLWQGWQGGDGVVRLSATLQRTGPPVALLAAADAAGAAPLLGTWRGQLTARNDAYGVEMQFDQLTAGAVAGRQVFFSAGPSALGDSGWCPGPLLLKERTAEDTYIFTKTTERGTCGQTEFRVHLADGGRLVVEQFAPGQMQPGFTGTLERKR